MTCTRSRLALPPRLRAVSLAVLVLVLSGKPERHAGAAAREALRVWLSAASADSEDDALARRLTAEIKAQGLGVVRAPAGTTKAQLPTLLTADTVAAVWVDGRGKRTEIWVGNRPAGSGPRHHVLTAASASQVGVLALRTVELLRASLVGFDETRSPSTPESGAAAPSVVSSAVPSGAPVRSAATTSSSSSAATSGDVGANPDRSSSPAPTSNPPATEAARAPARVAGAAPAPEPASVPSSEPVSEPAPEAPRERSPDRGKPATAEIVAVEKPAPPVRTSGPRGPHVRLMAGAGAFVPRGTPGPWLGGSARVAVLLPAHLFVAAGAFFTWRDVVLRGVEGEASLSAQAGRVALGRAFDLSGASSRNVRLEAAAGATLLRVSAAGDAAAGFVGFSRSVLGVSADLELGLALQLVGPLSVRASLAGGWLVRRPVLQFDTRRVGEVGRAVALGLLGLEASF